MRSRQRPLDDLGGDRRRVRVDVDQDRGRADGADRLGGGDEGVGRHDHLVAGADPERAQGELQGHRSGGEADRLFGLAVGGEVALEVLDLGAEGEGGVVGDPLDHLEQLGHQLGMGGVKADEGDSASLGCRQWQRGARLGCGAHVVAPFMTCAPKADSGPVEQRAAGLFKLEEERGGLLAGAHAELGEGRGEVALDRALGEEELVGDLGVGEPAGDEGEHLALAVGEGRPLDAGAQLARDHGLAAGDGADRHRQGGLELRLEDDAVGAGVERPAHAGPGRHRRDGDDRRLAQFAPQAAQRRHLARQVDIAGEDDDRVGVDVLDLGELLRVVDLGQRDLQVVLGHRVDDAPAHRGGIGAENHAELGRAGAGTAGTVGSLAEDSHANPTARDRESLRLS